MTDPVPMPGVSSGFDRWGARRDRVGLVLVLVAWPLSWFLPGLRTHLLFFPLWLGYVLAVDGLAYRRTGTSALARSPRRFALSFVTSVPVWWLFELANLRLGNWEYLGREHFGDLAYFLLCSLSFSTVLPAVLGTAELVRGFSWIERFGAGPRVGTGPVLRVLLFGAGLLCLALSLAWPRACFPLVWVAGVLILEPVCAWAGRRSLLDDLGRGDWRAWASLWTAGLVCGFFWELWNLHSYPKWIYHVPGVGWPRLFEMPLLGYLGYLPFALALWLVSRLSLPADERAPL